MTTIPPERRVGPPMDTGKSGDGGNRTRETFPPSAEVVNHALSRGKPRDGWRVVCADRLTPEQVLACMGARPARSFTRLPLVSLPWLDDRPRDVCGRPRSQATMPDFRRGKKPGNTGLRYEAQPLNEQEVLALLDQCDTTTDRDLRLYALIVLLWRSGLRISEALDLVEDDLVPDRQCLVVLHGKGDKMRYAPLDEWEYEQLKPWLERRRSYPAGPIFCVIQGRTAGGRLGSPYVRGRLKEFAAAAGIRKNVRPHQLRHSLAVELMRTGEYPLSYIQRALGHSNPATTATYLAGIGADEALAAVAHRRAPGGAS